ncbi:unnamed protein product [Amoebophrya sp. A120]|nr:unnamed protein product [Amoebophrya sp. A120]|eukprot:GSA120T00021724001.1
MLHDGTAREATRQTLLSEHSSSCWGREQEEYSTAVRNDSTERRSTTRRAGSQSSSQTRNRLFPNRMVSGGTSTSPPPLDVAGVEVELVPGGESGTIYPPPGTEEAGRSSSSSASNSRRAGLNIDTDNLAANSQSVAVPVVEVVTDLGAAQQQEELQVFVKDSDELHQADHLAIVPHYPEPAVSTPALGRAHCGHPREERKAVRHTFRLLLLIQAFVNYDSGAIPSVLEIIKEEFDLEPSALGTLGCIPYLGITVAAPIFGFLLNKYSQKTILIFALLFNAMFCALLAFASEYWHLLVARGFIGFTQAPFVIYSTVWVEEFAPLDTKTLWVALLQVGVPLGVMLGYLVAGLLVSAEVHWSYAMSVQCISLGILLIFLFFTSVRFVDNPWSSPAMAKWRDQFISPAKRKPDNTDNVRQSAATQASRSSGPAPRTLKAKLMNSPSVLESNRSFEFVDLQRMWQSEKNTPAGETNGSLDDIVAHLDGCNQPPSSRDHPDFPPISEGSNKAHSPADQEGTAQESPEAADDDPVRTNKMLAHSSSATSSALGRNELNKDRNLRISTLSTNTQFTPAPPSMLRRVMRLRRNTVFVLCILTLSVLYFVVTGVQYWATIYLVEVFRPPGEKEESFKITVIIAFSIVAATGPALGVVFGGLFIDSIGGYDGLRARISTMQALLTSALLATACGVAAAFVPHGKNMGQFYAVVVLLWFLLFFGGAMVPALTGMMLSVVRSDFRATASAVAQASFNVLGFAAGTLAPGVFMNILDGSFKNRLRGGMTLLFLWAIFGVLFILLALAKQFRILNVRLNHLNDRFGEIITRQGSIDQSQRTYAELMKQRLALESALNEVKKLKYDPRTIDVRIGNCKEALEQVYVELDLLDDGRDRSRAQNADAALEAICDPPI